MFEVGLYLCDRNSLVEGGRGVEWARRNKHVRHVSKTRVAQISYGWVMDQYRMIPRQTQTVPLLARLAQRVNPIFWERICGVKRWFGDKRAERLFSSKRQGGHTTSKQANKQTRKQEIRNISREGNGWPGLSYFFFFTNQTMWEVGKLAKVGGDKKAALGSKNVEMIMREGYERLPLNSFSCEP